MAAPAQILCFLIAASGEGPRPSGAPAPPACRLHARVRPHHWPLPASSNGVSSINHERRACDEACRR